ncbi:MAG: hypothetical protein CME70_11755 [Halobacteriovorax sp.]|nr:hypothetical protein [Halobacteriovorax sp.]|tara:strand:- start:7989 stop:8483 length:495 start_codon:yes stop_codon:yes gene_type:complete
MQETIEAILERVELNKKDNLAKWLGRAISVSDDSTTRTTQTYQNILFKTDVFFEGLNQALNETVKEEKLLTGVGLVEIVLDELGFEIEKEDAFIVYHLRDLGKFKITDKKLKEQLKGLWGQHKDYALDDQEFARTLKHLMRMGLLDFRKGNMTMKKSVIIRYKD